MKTFILKSVLLLCMLCICSYASPQSNDFGDAPDPPYPTLLVSNGARHQINPIFILGSYIDSESDGQPGFLALGDDNMGSPDDEDGVVFINYLVPGQSASLRVIASAPGFLNLWIDFQSDGGWFGPIDHVIIDLPINAGINNLNILVPLAAISNTYTYARFRFCSTPGLSDTGLGPEGEVEDYRVYIGSPPTGNVVLDPDPASSWCQNEISLTKVPVQGNLIAAYNDHPFPGGNGIGISYSSNSGLTWNALQLPIPNHPVSGIQLQDAFDPSVASNDSAHAFAAHIATDYNWAAGPASGLYVHKSLNGGVSWLPPVMVDFASNATAVSDSNYRFNDRCQIRCDRYASSPYHNHVYLTWIKDRGWNMPLPYSDIYFSASANGGKTFSPAIKVNEKIHNMANMPIIDVASDGKIYILWVDYHCQLGGQGILYLDKSTNGGQSWGADITVDTINLPPIRLNGNSDVLAKGAAILRVSPSNPNMLYIVYAAMNGFDECNIYFIKSQNGGTSWTSPLKINDDITSNDQVLPWMEVKPNGIIEVVWYDRRNDASDLLWDVYYSSSADGGTTFTQNTKLSLNSFSTPQTPNGKWFGEYLGLTNDNQKAYIAYTSSLIDTKGDIFFTSINNPFTDVKNYEELSLSLYPNPVSDKLKIVFDNKTISKKVTIKVYSILGKEILSKEINNDFQTEIEVKGLSPGVYLIEAVFNGFKSNRKFIKQ